MSIQVVFCDDIDQYVTRTLTTEHQIKNAVAKTYEKSWSIDASVDGTWPVSGTETVDIELLPFPDVTFRDFVVTEVNVTSQGGVLYISFS